MSPRSHAAKDTSGQLIKYMGSADIRDIKAGDTFGGRLPDGLPEDLVWNWDNGHTVDTADHPDIPAEVWELVLSEPNFADVTDLKVVPPNQAEQLWKGIREHSNSVPGGVAGNVGPSASPAATAAGGAVTGTTSGTTGAGVGASGDTV